jgi:tRNA (guanosine-2'-O-)-methyltransferase
MESQISGDTERKIDLIRHMSGFITSRRYKKMLAVLQMRTRHLTVVLEDIYQSHNASAVLRSCECLGIQDIHIIQNHHEFEVNPDVVMGASKWLSLHTYQKYENNTTNCLQSLKDHGYRIIATSPHKKEYSPDKIPLEGKTALVFGTEMKGLTEAANKMADGFMKIPMVGFTESLNISVAVALSVYQLTNRLRTENIRWQLPYNEEIDLLYEWVCKSVKNPEVLIRHYEANRDKADTQENR